MLSRLSPSARLAGYYFLFSAAWILVSGRVAIWLARDKTEDLRMIEDFKGLFFVLISSLFIFSISRSIYKKLMDAFHSNKEMLKKYQGVMNATGEGIYEYDIRTSRMRLSENTMALLDTKEPIIENGLKFWKENIHPEDRDRVFGEVRKMYMGNQLFWQGEYRFRRAPGEYREIMHRMFILKDRDQPYSIIGAVQDISDQRQLQREYMAQQIRYRTEITRNIISAEERERNRWAQELHDNIAQLLGVVRLYMGMSPSQPDQQKEIAQKTSELVEQSIAEIRQLSANLKPPVFGEEGLKDAIQSLIANISRVSRLQFQLQVNDRECNMYLNDEQKLMIYRIIQEQLNNITKYAQATHVSIQVAIDHPYAKVNIKDDGVGFDPDKLVSGIGLKNIRARLNMFNGHLEIKSAPGKGCELRSEFLLN